MSPEAFKHLTHAVQELATLVYPFADSIIKPVVHRVVKDLIEAGELEKETQPADLRYAFDIMSDVFKHI